MPRHSNPAAPVLAFFRTAPLEVAEVVLALAREAVAERRPKATKRTKKIDLSKSPIPGTPAPQQEQAAQAAKPRTRRKPQDVPLPGLPGPVSEVGG